MRNFSLSTHRSLHGGLLAVVMAASPALCTAQGSVPAVTGNVTPACQQAILAYNVMKQRTPDASKYAQTPEAGNMRSACNAGTMASTDNPATTPLQPPVTVTPQGIVTPPLQQVVPPVNPIAPIAPLKPVQPMPVVPPHAGASR